MTLVGETFGSRVAASVNIAANMGDLLVAYNRKIFVDQSVALAMLDHHSNSDSPICVIANRNLQSQVQRQQQHQQLQPQRLTLTRMLLQSIGRSLFNSSITSSKLERAYFAMYELQQLPEAMIMATDITDGIDVDICVGSAGMHIFFSSSHSASF